MANVFTENSHSNFTWDKLGDIKTGRPHLGMEVPVAVYRVLEYAMFDVLTHEFGEEKAQDLFRKAGFKAGSEFAANTLNLQADLEGFVAELSKVMLDMKIGIVRVEKWDAKTDTFTITIGEDLDCSGLPITGETVCNYDEGFIAGILQTYNKKKYHVREIDCWASGDRVCRFAGKLEGK